MLEGDPSGGLAADSTGIASAEAFTYVKRHPEDKPVGVLIGCADFTVFGERVYVC